MELSDCGIHIGTSPALQAVAAVLQRDYISVAKRDSSLIPVFLGWLTDSAVNEKDEVCFSPRLVAVLLRVLVHAFSYASSVSVVGFYADLLGRVEQAVRALLPSALPDGVGVLPSSPSPRHRRRAAENSMGGRAGYQEE